jgi:1-acyl-sn-glycerol-3-phosphate acyltransferase
LKDFYDGAFRLAIETQTPVKPVLFLDTYKRMPYSGLFTMTPGRSRIVYMEEVPVEGLTLNDTVALKERVFGLMEKKLVEYRAEWINDPLT